MRRLLLVLLSLSLMPLLEACGLRSLPAGPTPIPTLIPATEPARVFGETPAPATTILSYPAQLPSAARGKPLYETLCSRCHGVNGRGVVPGARDFSDLDYMRGENPIYFYAVITQGRRQMAGFGDQLTSDERWDVVFYVWRFSTQLNSLALGNSIYSANCEVCHGADGVGRVLGAADFTDLRFVDDRAPRDFYLTITQGKGSMPAWQGRLSQEERWAVIDYLRTFSFDPILPGEVAVVPPPPPTVSPTTCDVSYETQSNLFAWDDVGAITAGQATYDQACAICHGTDGSGALPGTPNIATAQVQSALRANSGQYLCIVAEGQRTMPGWKETLSVEQLWQVLTYIGTLGK